jgi:hypothetical protein
MTVALSLGGAADAAQIALTGIALLAFGGAVWQTILVRRSAREALTYNYYRDWQDMLIDMGHLQASTPQS